MNVIGKIGEKLKLTTNYNTESTFDFENQMKLEYTGSEDEIIKKMEVGNVSLPLNGTLITGSTSLFGMKAQLQFGKTTIKVSNEGILNNLELNTYLGNINSKDAKINFGLTNNGIEFKENDRLNLFITFENNFT